MFGRARPSLNVECYRKASRHPDEKLNQRRDLSWTVFGGARPAVMWTLLIVCITSNRKHSLTPRNKLGRDRGCWEARPRHQLDSFRNGCVESRRKDFSTPWKELGRVWGSTSQLKYWMFLKSFMPSGQKVDSTPWYELDRVWGSTTSRSFERCW